MLSKITYDENDDFYHAYQGGNTEEDEEPEVEYKNFYPDEAYIKMKNPQCIIDAERERNKSLKWDLNETLSKIKEEASSAQKEYFEREEEEQTGGPTPALNNATI